MGHSRQVPAIFPLLRLSVEEAFEQIDEHIIEAGQCLRDENRVELVDKGAGLWVAQCKLSDQSILEEGLSHAIEAELALTGRKVKAYHCECADFSQTAICAHLAALFGLVQLSKTPRIPKRVEKRPTSVTSKRLLANITDIDLRDFVQDYASKHPEFSLDLRVAFAQNLPVADRFGSVIDRLLSRSGNQLNAKEARRLHSALMHFAAQREQWLANKNWLDLFELNTNLVSKLAVIIGKSDKLPLDLSDYLAEAIKELETLISQQPPPVLLERIEDWAKAELERGVYFRTDLDAGFYSLLEALGQPLHKVATAIDRSLARFGESRRRLTLRLSYHYRLNEEAEAEKLLLKHLDVPDLVFEALSTEIAAKNYRRASRIAEAALPQIVDEDVQIRILTFIVGVSSQTGELAVLQHHAPKLVMRTGDLKPVKEALAEFDEAASQSTFRKVLSAIKSSRGRQSFSTGLSASVEGLRPELLQRLEAELLWLLSDINELEKLLYRTESEHLVLDYLPLCVGKLSAEDFALLLETKLREQLDHKLGQDAARWVVDLLHAVARRDRSDVATLIATRFRREYHHRQALIEALNQAAL